MHCLAIRHIACEDLGTLDAPLRAWFDRVEYVDMEDAAGGAAPTNAASLAALEAAADAELVVTLGGPMGVYEADRYPFLKREIELLSGRIAAARPTLGICLGAQLLAAAAGARVYPSGRQEIGWYPVHFTDAMRADPALGELAHGSDLFFHWHGDTFDLPASAQPLGASTITPRQGFAIGRHTLALQFHAEINAPILEAWLKEYEAHLPHGECIMSAAELRAGAYAHGSSLESRAHAFLNAWLSEILPRD